MCLNFCNLYRGRLISFLSLVLCVSWLRLKGRSRFFLRIIDKNYRVRLQWGFFVQLGLQCFSECFPHCCSDCFSFGLLRIFSYFCELMIPMWQRCCIAGVMRRASDMPQGSPSFWWYFKFFLWQMVLKIVFTQQVYMFFYLRYWSFINPKGFVEFVIDIVTFNQSSSFLFLLFGVNVYELFLFVEG